MKKEMHCSREADQKDLCQASKIAAMPSAPASEVKNTRMSAERSRYAPSLPPEPMQNAVEGVSARRGAARVPCRGEAPGLPRVRAPGCSGPLGVPDPPGFSTRVWQRGASGMGSTRPLPVQFRTWMSSQCFHSLSGRLLSSPSLQFEPCAAPVPSTLFHCSLVCR